MSSGGGGSRLGRGVVLKLILASVAMVTLPLAVFFAFYSWGLAELVLGDEYGKYKMALSGGSAALMVNVILIVYVIMAFMEDAKGGRKAD